MRSCLVATGAVVIEGPKACCARPVLHSRWRRPRLLDEWQVEPQLWNQVRRAVDAAGEPGQFLLTGSAVPADDAARHSGAGRFSFLRLRPMTLLESGVSNGAISLECLFKGELPQCGDPGLAVADLADLVCRGGWPAQLNRPLAAACRAARDYLEQVRAVELSRVDERRRDPLRIGALLRSLARTVATEVGLATLAADAGGADRSSGDLNDPGRQPHGFWRVTNSRPGTCAKA